MPLRQHEASFLGIFIGDALSMPVHWYYDAVAIQKDYDGWLEGYKGANYKHPSSILAIASPYGSGHRPTKRKSISAQPPVVGRIILHDKLKYWKPGERIHCHQGLNAGDNTLNALCALRVAQALHILPKYTEDTICRVKALEAYVSFMTTPGSHNDTYAESFHRAFFKDWDINGRPPAGDQLLRFAERRYKRLTASLQEDSSLLTTGALLMAIPFVLQSRDDSEDVAAERAVSWVLLTNPAPSIRSYVNLYARCLHKVLNRADLRTTAKEALSSPELGGFALKKRIESMEKEISFALSKESGKDQFIRRYQCATWELGSNCQIRGALKSLFFLSYMFSDHMEKGLLTNANCGGENCHRGSALGALLGAAAINQGQHVPQKLIDKLGTSKDDVLSLINKDKL
jgi:hypothetical protein